MTLPRLSSCAIRLTKPRRCCCRHDAAFAKDYYRFRRHGDVISLIRHFRTGERGKRGQEEWRQNTTESTRWPGAARCYRYTAICQRAMRAIAFSVMFMMLFR